MSRNRPARTTFKYFVPITTRWHDNDFYGHVNNVVYYSFMDTVANHFLIKEGKLDIRSSEIIAVVAASQCEYFNSVAYPDELEGGLGIERLGNSSVTYRLGIFKKGHDEAVAAGSFTHVFVTRNNQQSTPIPGLIRKKLQALSQ